MGDAVAYIFTDLLCPNSGFKARTLHTIESVLRYARLEFHCNMLSSTRQIRLATTLLAAVHAVSGQNDSAAGPPWVESQYQTSPPIYPSRK